MSQPQPPAFQPDDGFPTRILSRSEAAEFTKMSVRSLDAAAKSGGLLSIRWGRRVVFDLRDLLAFLESKKS